MAYSTGPTWQTGHRTALRPATPTSRKPVVDLRDAHVANVSRQADRTPDRARKPDVRTYFISELTRDGAIETRDHAAPADLFLEDIFAAFARGTLIATDNGPVAVEDLRPGDMLRTRDNGLQALRWIGSCSLPLDDAGPDEMPLRIKADALGTNRPSQDLITGPRFRALTTHPNCQALFGTPEALAPAADLFDGETILRVRPAGDLQFFNLATDSHEVIEANGLGTETYHPGNYGVAVMSLEMQSHLRQVFGYLNGDLGRFGKAIRPVLKGFEAEVLRAG
jgi:hypothetical protein